MTNVKSYIFYGISVGFLLFGAVEGSFWQNQKLRVELDNGYRWDRIDEAYEVVDSEGFEPYSSAEHQFKDLSSYQLGVRGVWESCRWYAKGSAHYGWVVEGSFNHDSIEHGHLRGNTADVTGGFGYVFTCNDCFQFIPMLGYAYDDQHFKVKHVKSFSECDFPTNLKHAHFNASWYGPWIGFDILYHTPFTLWNRCYNLSFSSGYEFHYGQAHFKFNESLFDPSGGKYNYHSKFNNTMGHVFHFDTHYALPCNWTIGLVLEYTYWSNSDTHRDHFSKGSDTGFTSTQRQKTFKLRWQAVNTILTAGKQF